eukprot:3489951-Alexandrium_andersonii.AAC.1
MQMHMHVRTGSHKHTHTTHARTHKLAYTPSVAILAQAKHRALCYVFPRAMERRGADAALNSLAARVRILERRG